MSLTVVIGGTRSGKSRHAERLARATGLPVRYVATADPGDPGMAERIRAHADRRPADWQVTEAGSELVDALAGAEGACVLIDGLGPWIATALHAAGAFEEPAPGVLAAVAERVRREVERLADAARRPDLDVIVVVEEASQGLLPPDRASRAWLDALGECVQVLSDSASRVELVVGGRALVLPSAADPRGDVAALRRHGDSDVRPGDVDHAVNVMGGGPPDWLRPALEDALSTRAGRYPSAGEATAALAALHGRSPDDVVPTNGAAEALWLLPAALRPRSAAVIHPGFTEAEAALHAHRVPVERVVRDPERDFALDAAAVPAAADLVVVGNPASPSGTLSPASAVLALRRPGRVVVVDEAFMDLVRGEAGSLAREPLDDVIVVRSLTKALGIPGLRAGYALASAPLADRLRAVRPPWAANALALAALEAAAGRPDALAALAARADAERSDLERRLRSLSGVRVWPGSANFVLVEVADGPAVVSALRGAGIAVRPAASFPGLGPGHIRITAREPDRNARLVTALEEALAASARVGMRA